MMTALHNRAHYRLAFARERVSCPDPNVFSSWRPWRALREKILSSFRKLSPQKRQTSSPKRENCEIEPEKSPNQNPRSTGNSEDILQRELQNPRIVRAQNPPHVGVRQAGARTSEYRMIEDIERLRPRLHLVPLGDGEAAQHSHVER